MSDGKTAERTEGQTAIAQAIDKPTKITKLVLDGFKSFGKRTELLFDEGFNVVIGPNGSGKSNIIDSLCFVLGKRSSKEMRAEKTANLIYNGGKSKNPAKQAEVSVVFDNKNKVFPIDEDSVKVTRIVKEDGQSKYKINGKTRTRQEILDLLAVAKINPDGYNIILQGDITRLVEMSPVERRQIVEEIAGISVYEEKKQQALNELEKVEAKLNEASVILRERERSLADLKKDRDQAIKHKELSDKIKTNKASYCRKQIDKKKAEKKKLDEKIAKHKSKLDKLQNTLDKFKKEINARKQEINRINEEIKSQSQGEQLDVQKQVEDLRVKIETSKQRISACQEEINKIAKRKEQLLSEAQELKEKLDGLKKQEEELKNREKNVNKQIRELDKTIIDFKKKHQLGEDSEIEKNIENLEKSAEQKQKELQQAKERQQDLLRQKDKIDVYLQTIDSKIEQVLELEKKHKKELDLLKNRKDELKKTTVELNELLNKDAENAKKLASAKQELFQAEQEHIKLSHKLAEIRQSLSENVAIKKILENKNKFGVIHGTVAELGSTDNKYAMALDVAAAHKAHSVVVEDDKTAAKCIAYLKKNKLGVAAFLPLNKIKPVEIKKEVRELTKKPGVHGLAIDLVECEPKFKTVFQHVFGNTLVVGNIETARKIGIGKTRMVTLDGDLCEHSGAMIGGFRHKKPGTFKAKEIAKQIKNSEKNISKLKASIEQLVKERQQAENKIERLKEHRSSLEGEILKTQKSLHLDSGSLEANQQYKEKLVKDQKMIEEQLKKFEKELAEKTQELTQIKVKLQEWRNKRAEIRNVKVLAELSAYEQKRKELYEQQVGISAELKSLADRHELFGRDSSDAERLVKDIEKEKAAFETEIKDLKKLVLQQQKELKTKEQEQAKFRTQFSVLFDKQKKLGDEISVIEQKMLEVEEKKRKEELAMNTLSIEETRVKTELSVLEQEFAQYEGVELDLQKSEEQMKNEIDEFEKLMQTIGAVNLRALDVYEQAEKEYNALVEKKDRLVKEKKDVIGFMEEIEGKKKDLFLKTLKVIDENFKKFFFSLTTKGEAYLELESPEQPFEGGLGIKVRLSGNKFLDIRGLSGGEKTLTALAFLFAIQEHEPASFYVLDEIDASLDKTNSTKLARLIRDYCKKAQYLVISHNDAVITEGDVLYGVSMDADKGLSSVVSLRA